MSLVKRAQDFILPAMHDGAIAIDATVGNGHDTLFLAQSAGRNGHIYGFDIQSTAIEKSRHLLLAHDLDNNVTLFHHDHQAIKALLPETVVGNINAVMFNLGYLPGSDKTIITQATSTLTALQNCIDIIAPAGRISIIAYRGHTGGQAEARRVLVFCENLDKEQFDVNIAASENPEAPALMAIEKKPVTSVY